MAPPMAGLISMGAVNKSEEQSLKRYYKTKIEDMQVMIVFFNETLKGLLNENLYAIMKKYFDAMSKCSIDF